MNIIYWIIIFILSSLVLTIIQILLRKKNKKRFYFLICSIAKFILAILFAFLPMGGPIFLRPIQPELIAFYIIFLGEFVGDLFLFIFYKKPKYKLLFRKTISVLISVVIFVGGTINSQNIIHRDFEIYSEKLSRDYKFVFISDMHIGNGQINKNVNKAIEQVFKIDDLDFVVLGGDIVDDYTENRDLENLFYSLKNYNEKDIKVFYIYGNHDRQKEDNYCGGIKFNEEHFIELLQDCNVHILKEEYYEFADDLTLLGREDKNFAENRNGKDELINPNPESFLACFNHQPEVDMIEEFNIDLEVSGHVHGGQLFPLGFFQKYTSGMYEINDSKLLVSDGFYGWRVPFKSQGYAEYDIVTLKSNK